MPNNMTPKQLRDHDAVMSSLLSILCRLQEGKKNESDEDIIRHYQIMIIDIENVIGRHDTFILRGLTVSPNF
jgi:hypothetical protein